MLIEFTSIFFFIISFNNSISRRQDKLLKESIAKTILLSSLSNEEIIQIYHNDYLFEYKNLKKVFYSKDNCERLLFVEEDEGIKILKDRLEIFDSYDRLYHLDFAYWQPESFSNEYYNNLEIAINNNKKLLENYSEETIILDENFKKYFVEIKWKNTCTKPIVLPFGSHYKSKIILKNSDQIKDCNIYNYFWYKINYSFAIILTNDDLTLKKESTFYILNDKQIIAVGKIKQ